MLLVSAMLGKFLAISHYNHYLGLETGIVVVIIGIRLIWNI